MIAEDDVVSQPLDELPLKNDKCVRECTDLHLGQRNINILQGFEKFVSLSRLFLNDNRINSLDGLATNFRIKFLYLHGNRIRRLDIDCLGHMTFLQQLTLNSNLLDDFDGTIRELKSLRHLTVLDMFDNPIAQEDNYRLRVIVELPFIKVLDRHRVTPEEVANAKKFKARMKRLQSMTSAEKLIVPPMTEEEEYQAKLEAEEVDGILQRIRKSFKASRSFPERAWLVHDRRNLGYVSEHHFWEVLKQHGVEQMLTESEKRKVVQKYSAVASIKSISSTGTLLREKVNYDLFCKEVVPSELRARSDVWTFDTVPEVSLIASELHKYVLSNTLKAKSASTGLATAMTAPTSSGTMTSTEGKRSGTQATTGVVRIKHKCEEQGLDPWISAELGRIVTKIEGDEGLKYQHSKEDLRGIFHAMKLLKMVPVVGARSAVDTLLSFGVEVPPAGGVQNEEEGEERAHSKVFKVPSAIVRHVLGCAMCPPIKKAPAVVAPTGKGAKGKAPAAPSAAAPANPTTQIDVSLPNASIMWRSATPSEVQRLEAAVNHESMELLDKLLRSEGKKNADELHEQTKLAAVNVARLGVDYQGRVKSPPVLVPKDIIRSAPNRSDIIVLPNLVTGARAQSHGGGDTLSVSRGGVSRTMKTTKGRPHAIDRESLAKSWALSTGTIAL